MPNRRVTSRFRLPLQVGFKRPVLRLLARVLEPRKVPHPFFSTLHELVEADGDVSIRELMDAAGEQTYGLLILVSGLTSFIPGVSMAGGLVALMLGAQLAWGTKHPWLPERLANLTLHRGRVKDALARFEGWLLKLGSGGKPGRLLERRTMGLVITWTAFLLAVPVPPIIPFGNALPAAAVCLQGAALLEERPTWAWLGLAGMVATTIYLGLSVQVILHYLLKLVR